MSQTGGKHTQTSNQANRRTDKNERENKGKKGSMTEKIKFSRLEQAPTYENVLVKKKHGI